MMQPVAIHLRGPAGQDDDRGLALLDDRRARRSTWPHGESRALIDRRVDVVAVEARLALCSRGFAGVAAELRRRCRATPTGPVAINAPAHDLDVDLGQAAGRRASRSRPRTLRAARRRSCLRARVGVEPGGHFVLLAEVAHVGAEAEA